MELLLSLLKQLAATLGPSEFLMVIMLIAGGVLFIVKFILKNAKGASGLLGFLTSDKDEKLDSISSQINSTASKEEVEKMEARIIDALDDMRKEMWQHNSDMTQHSQAVSLLKVELQNVFQQLIKQIDDVQHHAKMHDLHDEAQFAMIKEHVIKSNELINRAVSQIEKVDEFVRTTVPEFRSYHKDLTKEVHDLSRDISVMDRVLQAQINTSKEGITLR